MPSHTSQGFSQPMTEQAGVLEPGYSVPVLDLSNRQLCLKNSLLAWLKLSQNWAELLFLLPLLS